MKKNNLIDEVKDADSKVLAAHVVVYRTLGINKELAKACMRELSSRKDDFDHETFIEEKTAAMPKPKNMDLVKVTKDIQNQVRNLNVRKPVKDVNTKNSS